MSTKQLESLEQVVIRFAGDSGDGMQITGTQFSNTTAIVGNDLATFPDFPAEIRAPAGTLPGVSGFQVHFASNEIYTPGDTPDVLVAMNPAALKVNLKDMPPNSILVIDTDQPEPKVGVITRFRHTVNIRKMKSRLRRLVADFRFAPMHAVAEEWFAAGDHASGAGNRNGIDRWATGSRSS
jgi:2-oxoglutarate ferredoxin oxidoreductase subunit alpha